MNSSRGSYDEVSCMPRLENVHTCYCPDIVGSLHPQQQAPPQIIIRHISAAIMMQETQYGETIQRLEYDEIGLSFHHNLVS